MAQKQVPINSALIAASVSLYGWGRANVHLKGVSCDAASHGPGTSSAVASGGGHLRSWRRGCPRPQSAAEMGPEHPPPEHLTAPRPCGLGGSHCGLPQGRGCACDGGGLSLGGPPMWSRIPGPSDAKQSRAKGSGAGERGPGPFPGALTEPLFPGPFPEAWVLRLRGTPGWGSPAVWEETQT